MASIWKDQRTLNHVACFTAFVGQRRAQWKRSTYTTDKKLARRVADELEDAAQGRRSSEEVKAFLAGIGDLKTRRGLYLVFDEVLRQTGGRGLAGKGTRAFIESWVATTKTEVSASSWAKYDQAARLFLESLGGKADQDMTAIQREDIARFRDEQGRRVAASTANLMLKIVRVMFKAAETDGVISRNEAKNVRPLKISSDAGGKRRAFTLREMDKLLAVCDAEWRSLVLFGFYTGARLGDLAALTWQNLDLESWELHYNSRKTRRTVIVPLAAPLRIHVEAIPAGDDPRQPLHPRAHAILSQQGRSGTLSRQFGELLAAAGLIAERTHDAKKGGKGRSARRTMSEISFHALRHTAVSLLKSAGVSDAIARDLAGHESAEVSRLYTHIDEGAKRDAVNRLPDVSGSSKRGK